MPKIDIAALPAHTRTNYPERYRDVVAGRSRKRLGDAVGVDQFGVNLCTLTPGAASSLRHRHAAEDEIVYILQGEVVLIEDEEETVLKPGEAAGWKAGSGVYHHLVNRSERDAVFLEIGTRALRERTEYAEADLQIVKDESGARVMHRSGEPY